MDAYLEWKSRRDPEQPPFICRMTTSLSPLTSEYDLRQWKKDAQQLRDELMRLEREFPGASLPAGLGDVTEFCQRCHWIGCTLRVGVQCRRENLSRFNLCWP